MKSFDVQVKKLFTVINVDSTCNDSTICSLIKNSSITTSQFSINPKNKSLTFQVFHNEQQQKYQDILKQEC